MLRDLREEHLGACEKGLALVCRLHAVSRVRPPTLQANAVAIPRKMNARRPRLLVADSRGRIYDLPHIEAAGMKGGFFFRPAPHELVMLPPGSELFVLPGRLPVGYDAGSGRFTSVASYAPAKRRERVWALAAFLPPGFTVSYASAYRECARARTLPLFAYAACAYYRGALHACAVRVDRGLRHDPRYIDTAEVKRKAALLKKLYPHNRLIGHLEGCALRYGCPNAQNFFLSRYEAPLPVSPLCNARCAGCISYQGRSGPPATQPRIRFVPTAREVAEVACYHIERTKDPIVSFGQGCEGEPLLVPGVLEESIRLVRKATSRGTLHMNTNASRPGFIAKLFDAGLNSIRVSMNSARETFYTRYYRPRGYAFRDVLESIRIAKRKGAFVSVNYLTMPGFTDSEDEFSAFKNFLARHRIDMVQWRNLNYDPLRYFREIKAAVKKNEMRGIRQAIGQLADEFPHLMMGYFNPARRAVRHALERVR